MTKHDLVLLIASSALVSAVVSGVMSAFDRWRDRQAQRRSLLVEKSIELAKAKIEMTMRVAEASGRGANLYDPIVLAERYFGWLEHLEKHGRLPSDPKLKQIID